MFSYFSNSEASNQRHTGCFDKYLSANSTFNFLKSSQLLSVPMHSAF